MNNFDGDFSDAWLAEQVFSHFKDFKSEEKVLIDKDLNNLLNFNTAPPDTELENANSNILQKLDIPEINEDSNVKNNESQDSESIKYLDPSFFSEQNIVECANCGYIFDGASFTQHVCDYDEDKKLIIPDPIEETLVRSSTNTLVEPDSIRLLRENQIRIRRFLKDELKYDVSVRTASNQKLDGPHECTLCERKFVHASGLSRHMEKHALDLIPSSSPTNNKFSPNSGLKVVIKCTICGRIFYDTDPAFEHLAVHFPIKKENELNISSVSTSFTSVASFPYENYLDDALNLLNNEFNSSDNNTFAYFKVVILSCVLQCEFCDFIFSDVSFLFAHSASHVPKKPFECNACEVHVATSKQILMHWQGECVFARENMKHGYSSQRYYVCNVCENKFGSLEQLHEHRYMAYHFFPRMDQKLGVLLLPCEFCDQVFATAKEIVYHFEERHCKKNKREASEKYRQYLCDICGKTYTQSSHLWQHLRFHKGVKPFGCKIPGCDRRFTIRPDLNDHIRKCHTGERPYHCLICGRRFLTGSVFYQHRLIHRGERRYGCDDCGKRFYRADALKNHLRIHTGEKPFECLFCTKSFRQRGDRDKHTRARHSQLDANSRLMMQMRKMQLEAADRASANASPSTPDVNVLVPSMFQPLLKDIDATND